MGSNIKLFIERPFIWPIFCSYNKISMSGKSRGTEVHLVTEGLKSKMGNSLTWLGLAASIRWYATSWWTHLLGWENTHKSGQGRKDSEVRLAHFIAIWPGFHVSFLRSLQQLPNHLLLDSTLKRSTPDITKLPKIHWCIFGDTPNS